MKTLALALSLGLLATMVAAADAPLFSHARHISEGAECTTCHAADTEAARPELKDSACGDCHDEKPASWRLKTRSRRLRAAFPHRRHASAIDCSTCHQAVADDQQTAGLPLLQIENCRECHQREGVEIKDSDCVACHGRDEKLHRPQNHDGIWIRQHGWVAESRVFEHHPENCALCHYTQGDCRTCHLSQKPQSHTALWRMRGHGLAAQFDREGCKTCHQSSACINCHRSTPPLNHRGAWEKIHGLAAQSRSNEHCAVCHQLSWCAACHRGSEESDD
jgi:hypothetical protein